jgi:hypothetical protein
MTEHTPGPWTVEELTNTSTGLKESYIEASKGWADSGMAGRRTVAIVGHWRDRPNPQADAELIAKAPELAAENADLWEIFEEIDRLLEGEDRSEYVDDVRGMVQRALEGSGE